MRINQNISALNAYRNMVGTENRLNKSLERLSSGLRINRAADDAAGLAISEKMRGQIQGLNQAMRNAQDGISYIQTAEGALNETHSILQRMRELSVQAANDTLTLSDRQEIQKEIDQLSAEIDRIANTTEFNTKKLLDGTTSALTSTDSLKTKVFMRDGLRVMDQFGQKAAGGGNYKLEITADPGTAQIQKTDILKVKHGGDIVQNLNIHPASGINNLTASGLQRGDYTIQTESGITPSTADATIAVGQNYLQDPLGTGTATTAFGTGAVTLDDAATTDRNMSIIAEVASISGEVVTYNISYHSYDMDGNLVSGTTTETVNIDTSGNFTIDTVQINVAGGDNVATSGVVVGDKSVITVGARTETTPAAYDRVTITGDLHGSAPALNLATWTFNDDALDNTNANLQFFSIYQDVEIVNQHADFDAGRVGESYDGSIVLDIGGLGDSTGEHTTFTFDEGLGTVAGRNVAIENIDRFWDASGNFLVHEPQTITLVQGDGALAAFTIFRDDTIQDVVDKIDAAIRDPLTNNPGTIEVGRGLGQGAYAPSNAQFAYYVSQPSTGGTFDTVQGTIVINSAIIGSAGEIKFVGDDDVISALSLTTIREAVENRFTVDVTNAHSGGVVAENVQITGNRLVGTVHTNVDVEFDNMADIAVNWEDEVPGQGKDAYNNAPNAFYFDSKWDTDIAGKYETFVHLADNTTVFHIGANPLQDITAAIGDMRASALGVDNIQVTDRDSANKAISQIDSAIQRVSAERSKLGAVQNRLDHTINNLGVAAENLTAAESRIRDLDFAQEMIEFTRNQIMQQAGTSMLAQANMKPQSVLMLLG